MLKYLKIFRVIFFQFSKKKKKSKLDLFIIVRQNYILCIYFSRTKDEMTQQARNVITNKVLPAFMRLKNFLEKVSFLISLKTVFYIDWLIHPPFYLFLSFCLLICLYMMLFVNLMDICIFLFFFFFRGCGRRMCLI